MADILVTCPTCKTQLEIDAQYEGQEVECGSCLQVFVATAKKPRGDDPSDRSGGKVRGSTSPGGSGRGSSRSSRDRDDEDDDDDRGRSRRQRDYDDDDDDDDDYDHDHPTRRRRSGGNGTAVASLVLGIISILSLFGMCIPLPVGCCCGLGSLGCSVAAIITGIIGMKNPEGKGMAIGGLVMGVLTLVLIVALFLLGFAIGFAGAMNGNNPNNPNPNNNRFR